MTMKFWKWSKLNTKILDFMLNRNNSAVVFLFTFSIFFFVLFVLYLNIYYFNLLPPWNKYITVPFSSLLKKLTIFTHFSENECDASSSSLDICVVKLDKS